LEKVVLAHAQITFEERGYDPLESEPEKFRERCLERINNEQTWICTQDKEVIFKAELMCQTADVAYLEAIWTKPELRNRGYETRLLNELNYRMLQKSKYVYLLTEAGNLGKIKFYRKTGFEKVGEYTASYLKDNCQA
jgi:predicted GNAT family acetyltransferase